MNYKYPKSERLSSKIIIDKIIQNKQRIIAFPIKMLWLIDELPVSNIPVQSVIVAPKKRFKKAVHRNLIKRRIKEAFRQNKTQLYEKLNDKNMQLALLIIYNHNKILEYKIIEKAIQESFSKIEIILGKNI